MPSRTALAFRRIGCRLANEMLSAVSDTTALLERMAGWQAALEARDVDAASDFLHEEYALVLVVPRVVTMARDEWLQLLPDYVMHSYEIHEQVVHVLGDTAAILTLETQQATVQGADRSGRFVLSDIWRRDGGVWRVWRRHSTPATAGEMPRR